MEKVLAQEITISISKPPVIQITDIGKLIGAAVGLTFIVAALLAFLFLVLGGVQWIMSGGDKSAVESAQHRIQAALLGLFIVFASWAIMLVIEGFFGVKIIGGAIQIPKPF